MRPPAGGRSESAVRYKPRSARELYRMKAVEKGVRRRQARARSRRSKRPAEGWLPSAAIAVHAPTGERLGACREGILRAIKPAPPRSECPGRRSRNGVLRRARPRQRDVPPPTDRERAGRAKALAPPPLWRRQNAAASDRPRAQRSRPARWQPSSCGRVGRSRTDRRISRSCRGFQRRPRWAVRLGGAPDVRGPRSTRPADRAAQRLPLGAPGVRCWRFPYPSVRDRCQRPTPVPLRFLPVTRYANLPNRQPGAGDTHLRGPVLRR